MFKLFDGYSSTIDKINKKTDQATSKIIKASGQTDKFNKKLDATGTSAGKAVGGLGKFVSIAALVAGTLRGINITDEFTNTAARLDLINDGLQTQAELQDKIFAAADRSKGAYTDMASAISKMGILAGESFGSNDELIAFTELVQKSFKVGGASATEQSSALLQLTQAMSAGKLQGDEFRSIMENAPMIANAIAKFTGKSKGELKEMSAAGTITSDIIKNAMFMAADDINAKFKTMPMTFADAWNRIKNGATKAFRPLIETVNKSINTEGFASFVNTLIVGFNLLSEAASSLISVISKVASFLANNWSIIEPLLWGTIDAVVAYNAAMGIAWLTTLKNIVVKIKHAAASWLETTAIFAMIVAQDGLNAALAACPLTWIITGIIILIAVFYAAVGAVNKFAGASISATGIIVGAFAVAGAFIFNLFIGAINAMIQLLWTGFVEPYIGIIEWVLNVAKGGFDSFGGAVANLIGNIISWFLSLGKVVTKIIDAIFGTDWTSGLSSLQDNVLSWGKSEKAITLERNAPTIDKRIKYGSAWDTGYEWGKKTEDELTGFTDYLKEGNLTDKDKGFDLSKFGTSNNPLTVEGTGVDGSVGVDMADEDLQYLRDIAQRDYINKFSTATLAPNITVQFGDIHETADADAVRGRIEKILREEIATAAEGAYS